jgi:hypothetical protein
MEKVPEIGAHHWLNTLYLFPGKAHFFGFIFYLNLKIT